MKIITLENNVDFTVPFKGGWAINLTNKVIYSIDLNWEISRYFGAIKKNVYVEENSPIEVMIPRQDGYKLFYLDETGKAVTAPVSSRSFNKNNYQHKPIEKSCVFNKIFNISRDKIGVAIWKNNGSNTIVSIPNVFKEWESGSPQRVKVSYSEDDKSLLFSQYRNDKIVLMENPLK